MKPMSSRDAALSHARSVSFVPTEGDLRLESEFRQKPLGKGSQGMALPNVPRKNQVVPDIVDRDRLLLQGHDQAA